MMTFQNLTLQRGPLRLLENASVSLHSGWKVGLTGANGAGKSSLFKLLLGQLTPEGGELQMSGYDRIAHMQQEITDLTLPALDYVMEGHEQLTRVEAELKAAEAAGDDQRLAELHGEYDLLHGYSKKAEAEQLLAGLGFAEDTFKNPVNSFSGGWRIRLNLARTLFMPSDLLLLDEPTNHLDLDATLWLEAWLRAYPGTLLLISHDRDFLDRVVTHLLHLEHRQLNLYKGGYSDFEKQRAERLAQQQSMFEKQQREVAHMEDFIRRFKAKATKAKQAQSRIKALERMEKIAPAHVDSPFHFSFPEASKSSDPLLVMREADLGYAQNPVLRNVGFTLHPDQRIGLLGPNGAGKSTLIKSLVGDLPLVSGQRVAGEHLYIGYFAQHQLEALDTQATPLLHLQRLSPKESEQSLRNFLGGFGFQGDEALSQVGRFSGGEKARLALAIIAWQKPNLLLLDEPTNHLDLEMRHALTLALQEFAGAVLVVSHDRHLLKNTVDDFWLVADGQVQEFDGDLDGYAAWLKERQSGQKRDEKEDKKSGQPQANSVNKKQDRKEAARLREALKPLRKQVDQLEKAMDKARQELEVTETALADSALYTDAARKDELQALLKAQGNQQQALEDLEMQWLEASETLEQQTAELGL
ncbi:ATP-binding cassette, subfamily F, member 3 [Marinospirillum celere]|uniref:Probable ATP-binding protein YheS n=1 Tax=Marinospirillum celere TaxID=1122252 RepID=A0A1I1IAG8_9GAMM|nr:ATP-binding cassette domain-containing protein [Marinospirillum celere]SFC30763.1 ATP-binding cassette, subfamily F, member 3 [Marinospirillum celere]